MIEHVFDIILILISGSACFYCWLLNKRLKSLQDMKKGLGASIVTLSATLTRTNVAAQEAKLSTASSVATLDRLLCDVKKSISQTDAMLESLDRRAKKATNETKAMQTEVTDTIKPLLQEADKKAKNLFKIINEVNHYTAHLVSSSKEATPAKSPLPKN